MEAQIKIGLIGYGYAGSTFHAPLIAHSGSTTLTAIATTQTNRADADYPQALIVPDIDQLLAIDGLDCIVIATPNDTHFELAKRVLEAGRHVVVDKPVTLNSADAQLLADLAAQKNVLFAPFHNRRWDGDFLTVQALIASGTLGRITQFESHFDRFRPAVQQRWREDISRGGGLLFDLGSHLIDQALELFGMPDTISATLKQHRAQAIAPDYMHLQLGYADKEILLHASALSAIVPARFIVHGTRGSYLIAGLDVQEDQLKAGLRPGDASFGKNPSGLLCEVLDNHSSNTELPTRDGAYVEFYRTLAQSILHGTPFPVTAQDGVDVMRLIELAMQSAMDGQRKTASRIAL